MELYKLYRPKRLERLVGNTQTVCALLKMLEKKKVPHTILFHGPSGCGKTTLARILRVELECADGDVLEMNCSSARGIDDVREIMRCMKLSPTGGKCRVWILDEVHMTTKEAQNSMLKMLEDTPSHVYFFLCTTDPQKLLPTIRSRCSEMPVKLLTDEEMGTLIRRVCRKEEIELSDKVLAALVELAAGGARAGLVLLDKVRHLDEDSERIAAMQRASDESNEAIELCRELLKGPRAASWKTISKIIRQVKDVEATRWMVLNYAKAVLLGKQDGQAYQMIRAFRDHFYDSKEAGLVAACYEALYAE